jgi:hypothetical protein
MFVEAKLASGDKNAADSAKCRRRVRDAAQHPDGDGRVECLVLRRALLGNSAMGSGLAITH